MSFRCCHGRTEEGAARPRDGGTFCFRRFRVLDAWGRPMQKIRRRGVQWFQKSKRAKPEQNLPESFFALFRQLWGGGAPGRQQCPLKRLSKMKQIFAVQVARREGGRSLERVVYSEPHRRDDLAHVCFAESPLVKSRYASSTPLQHTSRKKRRRRRPFKR